MRMRFQTSAQSESTQGADCPLQQRRSVINQKSETTKKVLLAAKKEKACRASQMKLFWVFQVEAVARSSSLIEVPFDGVQTSYL